MLWRNIPVYVSRLCDGYIKHMVQSETDFGIYITLKHLGKCIYYDWWLYTYTNNATFTTAPIMSTGIINHQADTPPQLAPADEHYFTQFVDVYQ